MKGALAFRCNLKLQLTLKMQIEIGCTRLRDLAAGQVDSFNKHLLKPLLGEKRGARKTGIIFHFHT